MNEVDVFCDVLDNALLHLYLSVAETNRFTPKAKRNEILVRYLKPMIKDMPFKKAKKEIKNLISLGRVTSCDLEAKLVELYELSKRYDQKVTDARQLFNLLTLIDAELTLSTKFLNVLGNEQTLPNTIYMLQEQVENGFVESGEQVAQVSLFLESELVTRLAEFINSTGLFQAEIQQHNAVAKQGHIVLHPKR